MRTDITLTDRTFQPLMSIIFGNLTEAFVNFGTAVQNVALGSGNQTQVEAAAAQFRHAADTDAAILVRLMYPPFLPLTLTMLAGLYRYWYDGLRVRVHVCLGVYRRGHLETR